MNRLALLAILALPGCGIVVHGGSPYYQGLEVPLQIKGRGIRPVVGYAQVRENNDYLYAGLQYRESIGSWEYALSVAAGDYVAETLDLGHELEFRTSIEIFPVPRLGVGYVHISNAGFGESNPGFDALLLTIRF